MGWFYIAEEANLKMILMRMEPKDKSKYIHTTIQAWILTSQWRRNNIIFRDERSTMEKFENTWMAESLLNFE